MNAKELILGLHMKGAHKEGDEFLQTYLNTRKNLPPEISEATLKKIRAMGELVMLTPEQIDNSVEFISRGIGLNRIGCFDCGRETGVQSDMASFVGSKHDGERAVAMFEALGSRAKLDFRPSESSYVQVKVGACPDHKPKLERLDALTQLNGRLLHPALIEAARIMPSSK